MISLGLDYPLHGLILVGGKSARMKAPKAHMRINGKAQWMVAEEALSAICDQVYFSVSPQLSEAIPKDPASLIQDVFSESCGPLGGIISAFKKVPHAAFFVLACDMPFFDTNAALFIKNQRQKEKLATLFENKEGKLEPLCGIYEPAVLPHLLHFWSQARKNYCMRALTSELLVERVKAPDQRWLININSPADLEEIRTENSQVKKKISVQFYASLRQQTGVSKEEISSEAQTLIELFHEIYLLYKFREDPYSIRFSKNDRLVGGEEPFEDGDSIVFIPPVSGG